MASLAKHPPPGGDVTRAPTLIGVLVTMTSAATLCLAARLYTRFRVVKTPGVDDFILTFNMLVCIIPNIVCVGMQTKYGLGRHVYYLSEDQLLSGLKWAFIGDAFGCIMTAIPKLAVVVFIHKCLGKVRRTSLYALYALVAGLIVISILDICFLFFQCHPVNGPWTAGVKPVCWDPRIEVGFSYFTGASSAIVDLILALYPLTFILKLRIGTKQKVGAISVLGLGVFAFVCAVVRTTTLGSISHSADTTWDSTSLLLWAGAEANVITICASVPAIVPLFQRKQWSRSSSFRDNESQTSELFNNKRGSSFVGRAEKGDCSFDCPDGRITATTEVSVRHDQP